MALDRLDGLLQHKKQQQRKSQLALAREILRPHPMARQEVFIAQFGAQGLNEGGEVMGNVSTICLHPHINEGTAAKVQYK